MGYRSDVAIAIHKDVQGDFLTFLNTTKLMAEIFGDNSDFDLDKDYQGEGHWLFTCNSVKWYTTWDDYADIQMFEKFMDAMDEKFDHSAQYRFLRIGEERANRVAVRKERARGGARLRQHIAAEPVEVHRLPAGPLRVRHAIEDSPRELLAPVQEFFVVRRE